VQETEQRDEIKHSEMKGIIYFNAITLLNKQDGEALTVLASNNA